MFKRLSKLIAGACIIGSSLFYNANADNLQNLHPVPKAQVQELESIATKSEEPNRPDKTDKALFWSFNLLNAIDGYQSYYRFDRAGVEEQNPFMRELGDSSLYWPVKLGAGYYASRLALNIPNKDIRRTTLIGINLLYFGFVLDNEHQINLSYRF